MANNEGLCVNCGRLEREHKWTDSNCPDYTPVKLENSFDLVPTDRVLTMASEYFNKNIELFQQVADERDSIKLVAAIAKFAEHYANSAWTPISEGLPDAPTLGKQAKCLITVRFPDGTIDITTSGYWNDAGWAIEAGWKHEGYKAEIIAWMLKPKPFEEKTDVR